MTLVFLFLCFHVSIGEVLFSIDYSDHPLGTYTEEALETDWPTNWNNGVSAGRATIVHDSESLSNVLDVVYPPDVFGPSEGGAQWRIDLDGAHDELYSAYYILFPIGWDGVRGGKLPGLCGTDCPTGGAEVTGTNGFSARYMFRTEDGLVIYSYDMKKDHWGDDYLLSVPITRGVWMHLEQRIRMNTPGSDDGICEVWVDGVQALHETTMRYRSTTDVKVDAFYFSTFYGGGDSSWSPTKEEHIRFDGFVISDERIGYDASFGEPSLRTAAVVSMSVLSGVAGVGLILLIIVVILLAILSPRCCCRDVEKK